MTTQHIILPYNRSSIHIPRRDLVLAAADSMALEVSIIESDNPSALALDLTGGIGGPSLTLFIWPSSTIRRWWDYGAPVACPSYPLWSGSGVISPTKVGTFDITFPPGTMATWPRRCEWSMQLDWDHSGQSSKLACGNLHVTPSMGNSIPLVAITTDTDQAIIADSDSDILVA